MTPAVRVAFGHRHWLAQHRWLEPAIGMGALLAVGGLYGFAFDVLSATAAWLLFGGWIAFMFGAGLLWLRRPCTVLRLPAHALLVWIVVLSTAGVTGIAK